MGPELIRSFSRLLRLEYEDTAPEIRAGDLNVVWRILFDSTAVICDRVVTRTCARAAVSNSVSVISGFISKVYDKLVRIFRFHFHLKRGLLPYFTGNKGRVLFHPR